MPQYLPYLRKGGTSMDTGVSRRGREARVGCQAKRRISDRGDAGVDGPDADVKAVDRRGDGEEQCEERYCHIQLRWRVRSPSGHSEIEQKGGEEMLSEVVCWLWYFAGRWVLIWGKRRCEGSVL
ncbi:hypothetical protein GW17_00050198 [Ensete ventricosum]|nr:hypothetical protein GW17_00050198 [Ensete ventricosum]RZR78778.1 hypothetical protein BHM03_00004284 [Ensete ventricosum]